LAKVVSDGKEGEGRTKEEESFGKKELGKHNFDGKLKRNAIRKNDTRQKNIEFTGKGKGSMKLRYRSQNPARRKKKGAKK